MVAGGEYEVDCIIYASGFEVGTEYTRRAGYDTTGRDGVELSEHWADGHAHACTASTCTASPTLFIVQPTQGANLISNVPAQPRPSRARRSPRSCGTRSTTAHDEVEVTKEAEDAWVELLLPGPGSACIGSPDCTPGYYNNEGQDRGPAARAVRRATRGAHRRTSSTSTAGADPATRRSDVHVVPNARLQTQQCKRSARAAASVSAGPAGPARPGAESGASDATMHGTAAVTVDGEPGAVDDGA